jgi:hypothetical protein
MIFSFIGAGTAYRPETTINCWLGKYNAATNTSSEPVTRAAIESSFA